MSTEKEQILNNFSDALRSYRKNIGLTGPEFAEKLGTTYASYGRYERGEVEPPLTFVMSLLKNEPGAIQFVNPEPGLPAHVLNAVPKFNPYAHRKQNESVSAEPTDDEVYVYIPFYPFVEASAGTGLFAEDEFNVKIAFRKRYVEKKLRATAANLVALKVGGNSMYPELQDSDTIVIDKSRLKVGLDKEIFVVQVDDEVLCKYLQKTSSGALKLSSANERFEALELAADRVKVLGQVVWNDRTRV